MSDLDVDAIERRARAAIDWSVGANAIPGPWDHDILALVSRIRELEAREAQLRELHRPDGDYGYMTECVSCGTQWPCASSAIIGSETP